MSEAARETKSPTVYDEMAIMNDINAACAAVATEGPSTHATEPIEDRLTKLTSLKESELISEDEYRDRREAILLEV